MPDLRIPNKGGVSLDALKVLMIDDDEDDFVLVRDLLDQFRGRKFTLEWAATYEDGLEVLLRAEHDLCLLDHRLGAFSGLDLLDEALKKGCQVPIIVLTAYGDLDVDMEAMRAGAMDYLTKDEITKEVLERSIRYSLAQAQAQQALVRAREELERRVKERTAELAAANEALRNSAEKVKLFAYSVIHDLKSPAIAVHALTERIRYRYFHLLDEKGRHSCTRILSAAEQMVSLVEKIGVFISAKESPLSLEELDLKEILQGIHEEFSGQLETRTIRWSEPEEIPMIEADRLSIHRVFRNLVDNALKYGGEELGAIDIRYRDRDDAHVLSITDDGVGLKPTEFDEIFGAFTRRRSSKGVTGTGLGLAIVKEIAERHKGSVWLSANPSRGITVSVSISKHLSPQISNSCTNHHESESRHAGEARSRT